MPVKDYSALAQFYSHLMKSIDYKKWANYIFEISRELKREEVSVLELAAGNANVSAHLAKKFSYILISDRSVEMLRQCQDLANSKVCFDMTEIPLKKKFDFAFSTFDSVNYLLTKEKFIKMLSEVHRVLNDDGIFTFDVSLEKNSLRYQKYLNRKGKYLGIKYRQQSKFDPKKRMHFNYFEITFADGSTVEEIHKQKIYEFEEYFRFIDESGFYVCKCVETFSWKDANRNSERAQFILKKK